MRTPASQMKKRKTTISKRQKLQQDIFLSELRKNSVMTIACQKAGISRSTVYRWMNDDPEFANAVEEASTEGRNIINDMAESVIIKKIRGEDFSAARFWLTHNNNRYRLWPSRFADNAAFHEVQLIKESFKSFFNGVFRKRKK